MSGNLKLSAFSSQLSVSGMSKSCFGLVTRYGPACNDCAPIGGNSLQILCEVGEAPSLRDLVAWRGLFPTLKRGANEPCAYSAIVVVGEFVLSHPCDRKKSQGWGTEALSWE